MPRYTKMIKICPPPFIVCINFNGTIATCSGPLLCERKARVYQDMFKPWQITEKSDSSMMNSAKLRYMCSFFGS